MKRVITISRDSKTKEAIKKALNGAFECILLDDISGVWGYIYDSLPDLAIVEVDPYNYALQTFIMHIKADPMFCSLPFLAIIPADAGIPSWEDLFVDDYLRASEIERDLFTRVELSIIRSERIVEINPLTRLPGNISINKNIQKLLDQKRVFALAYLDIDHFKPFNDKYGFGRGDDVIKATGRLILNIVMHKQPEGSFVGHIGGDDFVYIMDPELIEWASGEIIAAFDRIIPTFYDPEDREKGFIESVDRQGNRNLFPIMTISIGIAHTKFNAYSHHGEIKEVASQMKAYSKRFSESCFKIDSRHVTL